MVASILSGQGRRLPEAPQSRKWNVGFGCGFGAPSHPPAGCTHDNRCRRWLGAGCSRPKGLIDAYGCAAWPLKVQCRSLSDRVRAAVGPGGLQTPSSGRHDCRLSRALLGVQPVPQAQILLLVSSSLYFSVTSAVVDAVTVGVHVRRFRRAADTRVWGRLAAMMRSGTTGWSPATDHWVNGSWMALGDIVASNDRRKQCLSAPARPAVGFSAFCPGDLVATSASRVL